MTPRKQKRVSVRKPKSRDYARVAENFHKGAELAKEFEYWNAAGVLIVHTAIAYTDAVTIRHAGVKSKGEDHSAAVRLLREILQPDEPLKRAAKHIERILHEKSRVSYGGEIYARKDIGLMWKHLVRYRSWARSMLET